MEVLDGPIKNTVTISTYLRKKSAEKEQEKKEKKKEKEKDDEKPKRSHSVLQRNKVESKVIWLKTKNNLF